MLKVAVITPIPTPYRDAFWQAFAIRANIHLDVVYCAAGKPDRPWHHNASYDYNRVFPASYNLSQFFKREASCYWNPETSALLKSLKPDVVLIGGYNHVTMLNAVRFCNRSDLPWLLMSESWRKRAGALGALKHKLLRLWVARSAGALPTGSLAAAYLRRLGVEEDKLCHLPNIPDISVLRRFSVSIFERLNDVKARLGVPVSVPVVMFAARMIDKKRPLTVVEAFARVASLNPAFLVMIGDGPLRRSAESLARKLGVGSQVLFPGFLEPEAVYEYMSVADLFVQPSSETWGVAPIEAMACGCRILISQEVGCHADIIEPDAIHIALSEVTVEAVTQAMRTALDKHHGADDRSAARGEWLRANSYEAVSLRLEKFLMQTVFKQGMSFAKE